MSKTTLGFGGRRPRRFSTAASDMCGGGGRPCKARLSSQELPAVRNAQAIPVILKKVMHHFFDSKKRLNRRFLLC